MKLGVFLSMLQLAHETWPDADVDAAFPKLSRGVRRSIKGDVTGIEFMGMESGRVRARIVVDNARARDAEHEQEEVER